MFKSNNITQKYITLKILAYNMMHLVLVFLLILISDVYCQSLNT